MTATFLRRIRLAAPLGIALLLFPSCVSSARHQRALDEADKLRRENTKLRQELTEERVLREEATEAVRRASGGQQYPAQAAAPAREPAASPASSAPRSPASPASTPAEAASAAGIQVENLEGSPEASLEGAEGDDGILRVARHYRDRGRAREALEAYTRLIKDYPFSPLLASAFMERGLLRESQGDLTGARSDLETVTQAFPDSPEASGARRKLSALGN